MRNYEFEKPVKYGPMEKVKLSITDKLYIKAVRDLKEKGGKMKNVFLSFDEIVKKTASFYFEKKLIRKLSYKFYIYSDQSGYPKSCTYKKMVLAALVTVNNCKIIDIKFDRYPISPGQDVEEAVKTNGIETRDYYLKKILNTSLITEKKEDQDKFISNMYDFVL